MDRQRSDGAYGSVVANPVSSRAVYPTATQMQLRLWVQVQSAECKVQAIATVMEE